MTLLREMVRDDLRILEEWFDDPLMSAELDGSDLPRWFAGVQDSLLYWVWMAIRGNELVGYVTMEIDDDGVGYEALAVRPDLRGQGIGTEILLSLLATPQALQAKSVAGGVDPENNASVRCHEKAGFLCENDEPDHEGFVYFIHRSERL